MAWEGAGGKEKWQRGQFNICIAEVSICNRTWAATTTKGPKMRQICEQSLFFQATLNSLVRPVQAAHFSVCVCLCVSVCVTKPISTMESHLNLHKVTAVKVCDACDINETSTMRICECQARERGRAGEGAALPVQLVEFAAVWSEVPYSNQSRKHKLYLKKQIWIKIAHIFHNDW